MKILPGVHMAHSIIHLYVHNNICVILILSHALTKLSISEFSWCYGGLAMSIVSKVYSCPQLGLSKISN